MSKTLAATLIAALDPSLSAKLAAPRQAGAFEIVTRAADGDKNGAARVEVLASGKGFAFFAVPGCAPDKRPGVCKLAGPADAARALILLAQGAERVKSPRKTGGKAAVELTLEEAKAIVASLEAPKAETEESAS